MTTKRKNAPLEASNVAVLLEHIPIGATRAVHSLQVKRVEADHYSIAGGPVIDLVDAVAQIGGYSGKHSTIGSWYAPAQAKTTNPDWSALAKKAKTAGHKLVKGAKALASKVKSSKTKSENVLTVMDRHGKPLKVKQVGSKWHYYYDGDWVPLEWLGGAPEGRVFTIIAGMLRTKAKTSNPRGGFKAIKEKPQKYGFGAKTQEEYERKLAAAKKKQAAKSVEEQQAAVDKAHSKIRAHLTKKANPAAKFERGKAVGGGHREERGYFYEVLNSEGAVVAMTTSKAEAQEVCDNPTMIKLPKGRYTLRHVGGKSVVPATAGIRARKVK